MTSVLTGTTMTPGGTTGYNLKKWQRTSEAATYQRMVFVPLIDEGDRPYGELNIRKQARVASAVLAQGATGETLASQTIIGTPVTVTPAGNYILIAWSENEDAQIDLNLDAEARGNIEQAMAESTDSGGLELVATLTQFMSQTAVDAPMFRKAFGRLMGNTNGLAEPGKAPQVYGIFSHTQYPNLGLIPEFNAADLRGGGETPYVSGIFTKGGGVNVRMTTVVKQDANGWHNVMFVPSAFVVAWNVRSRIKRQDFQLANWVIIYNNLGYGVKHDMRAIGLRTTQSGLGD